MTACTRSGIDLHRASNCLGGIFSQQRKNFRQFPPHLLKATRVVANPGEIDVHLSFEENPGVLNWIEVRGVRRMGLKRDVLFLEGEHELCERCLVE